MISTLLVARIEGEPLSYEDLLRYCLLLLIAGNETTTHLIGNAFLCFDEHQEVMDELRTAPELMGGALEEILRYLSPAQSVLRRATVDTQISGQQIKARSTIH